MPTEYLNRVRRNSDGVYVYWTTTGSADPTLSAANAPSPSGNFSNPVVAMRRSTPSEILQESLTAQINGSNSSFTTSQNYKTGTLTVRWNGQVQALSDVTETGLNTFNLSLTPESGDAIEVAYRPA